MREKIALFAGLPILLPFWLIGALVAFVVVGTVAGWLAVVDSFNS